ncbi:hypothetical protein lerEdw1_000345 [Lerista edwardsae]|nr:hypothetical protein lerEdw1_000345 [Lerista edwardsae]
MLSLSIPTDVNECEAEPCKNGGICTDLIANYSCECPGEFMGRNCQYKLLSPQISHHSAAKSYQTCKGTILIDEIQIFQHC